MIVTFHPLKTDMRGYIKITPQTDFEKTVIEKIYQNPIICFERENDNSPMLKISPKKEQE